MANEKGNVGRPKKKEPQRRVSNFFVNESLFLKLERILKKSRQTRTEFFSSSIARHRED